MKINFCTGVVTSRDGFNIVALLGTTDESQRAIILALVWRQGPRSGKMDTRRRLSKCHLGQIYLDKICPLFIYVRPSTQGSGIGSAVLTQIFKAAGAFTPYVKRARIYLKIDPSPFRSFSVPNGRPRRSSAQGHRQAA